ncbi:hypothetical protein [Nakamurella lactea]|uniref:hypothetical protein n=1 Tax=Nakamurella lactea TaxID=459515 RepID=UPI0003F5F151|nr:hypothetical protein [Nakamurella lactea]
MMPRSAPEPAAVQRVLVVMALRFSIAALVYAVGALVLASSTSLPIVRMPLWVALSATVATAWVLWALRGPVDRLADRVVYRGRASGYAQARDLLDRLADAMPVDDVLPQLAATVGRVAHSSRTEVRLWLGPDEQWREVWPQLPASRGDSLTIGVRHLGDQVGEIEVERVDGGPSAGDRRQLNRLAAPAGTALATVRLTYALRRRRAELEQVTAEIDASTRRLLGAQREEQRRFRREITSRVLPHLDAAVAHVPEAALAAAAAGEALDEVRQISRGLFPPRLAEAGLTVALTGWADDASWPVRMTVDPAAGGSAELQACLYFCVVSLLNILGTAGGRGMSASVRAEGTMSIVTVVAAMSPAPEQAEVVAWTGLVVDRMAAFDGSLQTTVDHASVTVSVRVQHADPGDHPAAEPPRTTPPVIPEPRGTAVGLDDPAPTVQR